MPYRQPPRQPGLVPKAPVFGTLFRRLLVAFQLWRRERYMWAWVWSVYEKGVAYYNRKRARLPLLPWRRLLPQRGVRATRKQMLEAIASLTPISPGDRKPHLWATIVARIVQQEEGRFACGCASKRPLHPRPTNVPE